MKQLENKNKFQIFYGNSEILQQEKLVFFLDNLHSDLRFKKRQNGGKYLKQKISTNSPKHTA